MVDACSCCGRIGPERGFTQAVRDKNGVSVGDLQVSFGALSHIPFGGWGHPTINLEDKVYHLFRGQSSVCGHIDLLGNRPLPTAWSDSATIYIYIYIIYIIYNICRCNYVYIMWCIAWYLTIFNIYYKYQTYHMFLFFMYYIEYKSVYTICKISYMKYI